MKLGSIIGLIIVIIVGYIVYASYIKPFRFESFKTTEEVQTFMNERYKQGLLVSICLNELKKVGAKCLIVNKDDMENQNFSYSKMYFCEYNSSIFSFSPLIRYPISIYTDNNDKLVAIKIARHPIK